VKALDRLLRTITAPCTEPPSDDLTEQTCPITPVPVGSPAAVVSTATLVAQVHVLELEVIGFVLPKA
jgi:hypothetical protein